MSVLIFGLVVFSCSHTVLSQPLVVTTLLVPPFLTAVEETAVNGTKEAVYQGYIRDLMDELARLVNITYVFSVRQDSRFGQRQTNGTWDGIIGDVVNGRADIAAAPLTETSTRMHVVDFSTPFMNFGPVIVLKKPQSPVMTLQERLQRLFAPLQQSIWMMSGLAWFITSVVLYLICHVDPYEWRQLAKDHQATHREGESFTCPNTFWFTTSNLMWQGYTRSPRSLGARIVVTFWWLYVLIFVIVYISSMTNYLRVGPTKDTGYSEIRSIDDLAVMSHVSVGVIEAGSTAQYLMNSQDPALKKIWSRIKQNRKYEPTLPDGVNRVRSSKKPYAFIAESAMAKYFATQTPCDLYLVGDLTTIGAYALAFPVNSKLVKQVDIALLRLREKGVLARLEDRWFDGVCEGYVMEADKTRLQLPPFYGVDLGSFSGALIILSMGLILGSLAAVVEVVVFKVAEQSEKSSKSGKATIGGEQKPASVATLQPEPITDV